MIAYSCNLSCAGCISLSDLPRKGIAKTDEILSWIKEWSSVIQPQVVAIFGGEPCLHPDLVDICKQVRVQWPDSIIRLITNGYLLDNFDCAEWFNLGRFEIQVSVHRKDHEELINTKIKKILEYKKGWRVQKHNNIGHKQIEWLNDNLSIYKSIFKDFITPYKDQLKPWNSDPAAAHRICGSPSTPILYKGKLYKCPPIANLIDLTGNSYANYQGVSPTDNIESFVSNIGRPENVCGNCPDQTQAVIINHFNIKNVVVKQKISY